MDYVMSIISVYDSVCHSFAFKRKIGGDILYYEGIGFKVI